MVEIFDLFAVAAVECLSEAEIAVVVLVVV